MDVQSLGETAAQGGQGQATTQDQQGASAAHAAASDQKPSRPDWLPETYFDADKGTIKFDDFGKHYGEIATAAKAEQDRLAAYPQKVEDLKFDLPAEIKLPEGAKIDDKNPTFQKFRQFAFDKKIDPRLGSELLGMYVGEQVAQSNAINKRVEEERAKLGSNAVVRIAAIGQFLDGAVGKDLSKAVMASVFTAQHVEAMEKIVLALSNQNTKGPTGAASDAKQDGPTDEEYEAMSPRQRLDYARSKQRPA